MIELPGHEVIVPNAVFAQPTPDFSSKYITVVSLFDESRPSDTWDYLQQKVEGLVAIKDVVGYKPKSQLEKMISKLPREIQTNFAANKEKYSIYLLGDVDEDDTPSRLLEICLGVMPLDALAEGNGDPQWYLRRLFELKPDDDDEKVRGVYGLGELLHIRIRLENGLLPAKERIENLVSELTSQSRVLEVSLEDYDPEETLAVISQVYHALESENFEKIRVMNDLEDFAVSVMQGILADIKAEKRREKRK